MAGYAVSNVKRDVWGSKRAVMCRITGDGTAYTANGDVVTPAIFGLRTIDHILVPAMDIGFTYYPIWVLAAGVHVIRLFVYDSTPAEASGTHTAAIDVVVIGT